MHPGIVAARWPGKMAVVVGDDDRLTYAELDRQSDALARAWRARGLGRGDVVALLLPNASRFFTVAWAAQRSGMYYVALPMQATVEEIAYILDDARPRAFVVDGGSTGRALAALDLRRGPDAPPFAYATPEDPSGDGCFASLDAAIESGPFAAYEAVEGSDMLYTSGTTGRPKGVKPPLTQAPLGNDPRRTERARTLYAFDESSVFLLPAPVYHAAPLRFGMTALRLGSTLVLLRKFSPHAALAALGEHGVTHSQWVPTMFSRLLALPERERAAFASASHRVAIHSGGPCSIDVKQRMIDWWGPILHEYYSGSESIGFTHADSAEWLAHPGTVGRPFGCTLHIVDDDGRECAPGTVGNVFFESAHRLAYHNDEEKTRSAIDARGWATMGDIGYVDGDGYLYLTDRRAFTVVSGGVNVYPREVEIALESHPDVIEAAAFGVPDVDLGERVHAVVAVSAARRNDPALAADVLRHARDRVAAYKLPKVVDVCDELPHLPSGKLDKRSVRERARTSARKMKGEGMLRDDLLTMLSIKGFARADGLTDALGIQRGDVDAELSNLGKLGLADESKIGWRLSADGKDAARNVAEHERAGLDGALMEDAYACFVAANDRFKATIVRWQMRDLAGASVPNDHSDAAYDASVVDEIRSVHAEIVALLDRLAEHVRRAATYRARFERALERIARGERRFVAAPIVESYHTIWFELHEDLIRLSGRNRHDEAAAGRGA